MIAEPAIITPGAMADKIRAALQELEALVAENASLKRRLEAADLRDSRVLQDSQPRAAALDGQSTRKAWPGWAAGYLRTIHSLRPEIPEAQHAGIYAQYFADPLVKTQTSWYYSYKITLKPLAPPSGTYQAEFNMGLSILFEDYGTEIGGIIRAAAGRYFGVDTDDLPSTPREANDRSRFSVRRGYTPNKEELGLYDGHLGEPPMHRSIWFLVPCERRALAMCALASQPAIGWDELVAAVRELAGANPWVPSPHHHRDACAYGSPLSKNLRCGWCAKDVYVSESAKSASSIYTTPCVACFRWPRVFGMKSEYRERERCAWPTGEETPPSPNRSTGWLAWIERLRVFKHATPLEWFALAPEACLQAFIATRAAALMLAPPASAPVDSAPAAPALVDSAPSAPSASAGPHASFLISME